MHRRNGEIEFLKQIKIKKHLLSIIIKGKPIGKDYRKTGNFGKINYPINDERKRYRRMILEQLPKGFKIIPIYLPVLVNIRYYFIPSNCEKIPLLGLDDVPCIKRIGDLDNLNKFLLDTGNKIIWEDDTQIFASNEIKLYSHNQRTEIDVIWRDFEEQSWLSPEQISKNILREDVFFNNL